MKQRNLISAPNHILISAANEFKDKTNFVHQMWQTDFTYFKIIGWGWYYLSTILTDSKGYQKKSYRSSEKSCADCPLRPSCCGKVTKFKKIEDSIHKPLYDRMHEKITKNKRYFKKMVKRRSSTVEPVLGTLINHHNMKRINSRGMAQANKHVLLAALCYNLKKYLKFAPTKSKLLAQLCALPKVKHSILKTGYLRFNIGFSQPLYF